MLRWPFQTQIRNELLSTLLFAVSVVVISNMPRRGVQPVESSGAEEPWIWGNHRGGGGAPVKDMSGNQVSNLRQVFRGGIEVDASPIPSPHKLERIASPIRGLEGHYSSQNTMQQTPKRVMGLLRHENEVPADRDAKFRKETEYQMQLREQIEEKKRRKEQEKEEENAVKRRELDEYLASQNRSRKPERAEAPSIQSNNRYSQQTQPQISQSDKTDRKTKEPNLNIDTNTSRISNSQARDAHEGYVTQSAYDELTKFCEQLMRRQSQLEEEISQQAEIIQVRLHPFLLACITLSGIKISRSKTTHVSFHQASFSQIPTSAISIGTGEERKEASSTSSTIS